jgi:hypothetical protein
MFLAQPIIHGPVVNYRSRGHLPYNVRHMPSDEFRDIIKNPKNPTTEYHAWMAEYGIAYDRASIIKQFNNDNKNFHVKHAISVAGQPAHRTPPDPISQMNYSTRCDKLFTLLIGMNWCDKDVAIRTISSINSINTNTLRELMPTMKQLADELKTAVSNHTAALESLDEEEQYNFLFHIIAKGEQFYISCCVDPGFCAFIIPEGNYQNLFTMLKKKYRVVDNHSW